MPTINELQLAKELIRFPSVTKTDAGVIKFLDCLLYTSPSPRDYAASRMPSSA